jgi:YVTN family beta-propeller protein
VDLVERLFVANAGEDTISVIDPDTLTELERLRLRGAHPLGPKRLLCDGERVIYMNTYEGSIGAFDMHKNTFKSVALGMGPSHCCMMEGDILVCCAESDSVWRIETASLEPSECASFGAFPYHVSSYGPVAAVAHIGSGDVVLISSQFEKILGIEPGGMPMSVTLGSDDLYVSYLTGGAYGEGGIARYTRSGKLIVRAWLPCVAGKLCVADSKVYASSMWDSGVTVLNSQLEKLGVIQTCTMPDDMLIDEVRGQLYVSCMLERCVEVRALTGELRASIPVGIEPRGLLLFNDAQSGG